MSGADDGYVAVEGNELLDHLLPGDIPSDARLVRRADQAAHKADVVSDQRHGPRHVATVAGIDEALDDAQWVRRLGGHAYNGDQARDGRQDRDDD